MIVLLLAGGCSLAVSLVGTRFLLQWLVRHRVGQPIREDGPQGHAVKAGTPTMGGIAIVAAAAVGYAIAHVREGLVFTRSGLFTMFLILGAGGVGMVDDWIKVKRERNLGLSKRAKFFGLLAVAVAFTVMTINWSAPHTTLSFTRFNSFSIDLGPWLWSVWAVLLVVASTNGVNLTDGQDGLAAGSGVMAFVAFAIICFWAYRNPIYDVPHAWDLAVVAVSMAGACAGFLWWNAAPAQLFMGDTGALAIGAALAGLALMSNTQLLLVLIGGLYVIETGSVILQVISFRVFHRRIFKMSPLHHHYDLRGWPETTIVIRLWIVAGLCTALGLGIFYADFLSLGTLR